jgi:hypothetical protein
MSHNQLPNLTTFLWRGKSHPSCFPNQIFLAEEEGDTDCRTEDWCSEHKTRDECEESCHFLTGKIYQGVLAVSTV